jgi:colanic acid/amylovoran biosynthesis glycosyltransferase
MKIWYVTMQFPFPSETFAGIDILALRRAGADVVVHSLRPPHPNTANLVRERGLADIPATHNSAWRSLRGVLKLLGRPGLAAELLLWLLKTCRRKPRHLLRSLALVPRVIDLFTQLERERPAVVHLFWGHFPAMLGHLVQRRLPETVVSVFLGAYDLVMRYGGSAPVARQADVVWTHAQMNVPDIEALGVPRERVRVVYRGVELEKLATFARAEKIPRRIISAGRLIKSKGTDDVIHAFKEVAQRWPDASLVILGGGPQREPLEALVKGLGLEASVTFSGHVSHQEVLREMSQAEVFIMMSKKLSERLPNAVKEAVGCRCLCIVTETPGIEELLQNEVHGFVIRQGDSAEAARLIDRAFADPAATTAMIGAASAHLAEHFDVDRSMAEYYSTWAALAERKQGAAK